MASQINLVNKLMVKLGTKMINYLSNFIFLTEGRLEATTSGMSFFKAVCYKLFVIQL